MEVKTDERTGDRQYTSSSTEQLGKEHSASEKIMQLNIKTNMNKGRGQNNLTLVWKIEAKQDK